MSAVYTVCIEREEEQRCYWILSEFASNAVNALVRAQGGKVQWVRWQEEGPSYLEPGPWREWSRGCRKIARHKPKKSSMHSAD
jgi:hypothetical protein